MLKSCSLFSGSTGNSSLIQSDTTNILVDIGVSAKRIEEALNELEVPVEEISGILVIH